MLASHALLASIRAAFAEQRPHLALWLPAAFAGGIGIYFALPGEPGGAVLAAVAGLGVVCGAAAIGPRWRAAGLLACFVALGFVDAALRARMVAGPVLERRVFAAVWGEIAHVDRSVSDRPRITLRAAGIAGLDAAEVPRRLRISLHGPDPPFALRRGERVMTTAHLGPPPEPVEPGGFDFRRHAWFQGIGAVGYARAPLLRWGAPADPGLLGALRDAVTAKLRAALPGRTGAFAAAIVTGDRAGVDRLTLDDLRAANLAHLLAISGLHMGLLAGAVLACVRLALAALPTLAARAPARAIAAMVALAAAAVYLALSGAAVATQRAFVMVAIMLLAVVLGRRAVTLHSVALAALVVLAIRPESLMSPGFQMSFAATAALVAVFSLTRDLPPPATRAGRLLRPVLFLVLASAVAGAATAPFAALHFNRIAAWGLVANLASVPVMGLAVMPAALAGLVLWPLGLDAPAWWVMGAGIDWILSVAHAVSALPGAIRPVPAPPAGVAALLGLGMMMLIAWRGAGRLAGAAALAGAVLWWGGADRPDVLISADGRLAGVLSAEGRVFNKPRGQGFAARAWLEHDGAADPLARKVATGRALGDAVRVVVANKARDVPAASCRQADVVLAVKARAADRPGCLVVDGALLARTGALAITRRPDGTLEVAGARRPGARRLWDPPPAATGSTR